MKRLVIFLVALSAVAGASTQYDLTGGTEGTIDTNRMPSTLVISSSVEANNVKIGENTIHYDIVDDSTAIVHGATRYRITGGAGQCQILIEADTDNTTETDHPYVTFTQDGRLTDAGIGFKNGLNHFYVEHLHKGAEYVDLVIQTAGENSDVKLIAAGTNAFVRVNPFTVSGKTFIFDDLGPGGGAGSEPTFRPTTTEFGYVGTSGYKFWRFYVDTMYADNATVVCSATDKTNITYVPDASMETCYSAVRMLKPATYQRYDKDGETPQSEIEFGLIMEDCPDLVKTFEDGEAKGFSGVSMMAVLASALIEAASKIEELEARIETLEGYHE